MTASMGLHAYAGAHRLAALLARPAIKTTSIDSLTQRGSLWPGMQPHFITFSHLLGGTCHCRHHIFHHRAGADVLQAGLCYRARLRSSKSNTSYELDTVGNR